MASTYPHYLKHPLDLEDSFRLIELQAGEQDDNVRVILLNHRLSDTVSYEAVSYAWGDASLVMPIQIVDRVDQDSGAEMHITANCHAALKRLRNRDIGRLLWIDSICIDQRLVRERNHQLGLMARIYSGASRVVAYIGEAADGSDSAMDCIREIDRPSDYGSSWELCDQAPRLETERTDLQRLFQRSWFRRVWVLQEIALAKDAIVVCGDRQVEWECFRTFNLWNTTQKWVDTLPYSLTSQRLTSNTDNIAFICFEKRLKEMLIATRHYDASDAKDKLYGILPLLEWEHRAMQERSEEILQDSDQPDYMRQMAETARAKREVVIKPDYGLSASEVYAQLAADLICFFGLDMLQEVRASESADHSPGLPSWAPDWSVSRLQKRWINYEVRAGHKNVPKGRKGSWDSSHDGSRDISRSREKYFPRSEGPLSDLHTQAVRVGRILKIGDVCDISQNIFPLKQWTDLATDSEDHRGHPTAPSRANEHVVRPWDKGPGALSPFQRTLANDDVVYPTAIELAIKCIHHYNGDDVVKPSYYFDRARDRIEGAKLLLADIFKGMPASYRRQAKVIFKSCDGRRFFVTDTGYMGLAPGSAEAGDAVFVLEGAKVPFVFRRHEPINVSIGGDEKENPRRASTLGSGAGQNPPVGHGKSVVELDRSAVESQQSIDGAEVVTRHAADPFGMSSRRQSEDQSQYMRLIGTSFVHGVMYGELWRSAADEKEPTTFEEIVIR